MDNLWKKLGEIKGELESPKVILEQQANYLNNAMNGWVRAEVVDAKLGVKTREKLKEKKVEVDFIYSFTLASDYIDDYTYKAFGIAYGIKFYPLCIMVNSGIAEEIEKNLKEEIEEIKIDQERYLISNETQYSLFLSSILNSDEMMTVLKNLKNLAESEVESNPFV